MWIRRLLLAAVLAAGCLTVALPAAAVTPHPPVPTGLPKAIEALATYVQQKACQPVVRPGTAKLAQLLATTYRNYGATSWASGYPCGTDGGRSEHYDGRAIDWMVDVHDAKQYTAARAAIAWLLATDAAGNTFAMARRLGVMYLIYDNRMWGAWDGRWEEYGNCSHLPARSSDNYCHRTHMHISLSWDGAMARTSYWTKRVAAGTDYGPCRPSDLNWANVYVRPNLLPCPDYPLVKPAATASATKRALVTFSGAAVHSGSRGPAVSAVQRGLGLADTAVYGAATVAAVRAFQSRHLGCPVTGGMNPATWRALLAAVR
jgi:hypothetical protein